MHLGVKTILLAMLLGAAIATLTGPPEPEVARRLTSVHVGHP